jgi:TPR repeat protein
MQHGLTPAVAKADDLDAAGNHRAAVDQLAIGARNRDVEALTRLGKRLLVGDRAPALPAQGAGFLEEAVQLGGAEAAAVLAVIYAVGASKRHGSADALDTLTVAAERGWSPAQTQLRVLPRSRRTTGGSCARASISRPGPPFRRPRPSARIPSSRSSPACSTTTCVAG